MAPPDGACTASDGDNQTVIAVQKKEGFVSSFILDIQYAVMSPGSLAPVPIIYMYFAVYGN
jgi:hypothetical protein